MSWHKHTKIELTSNLMEKNQKTSHILSFNQQNHQNANSESGCCQREKTQGSKTECNSSTADNASRPLREYKRKRDNVTKTWVPGQFLAFKDGGPYLHSVIHRGTQERIVMSFDLRLSYVAQFIPNINT